MSNNRPQDTLVHHLAHAMGAVAVTVLCGAATSAAAAAAPGTHPVTVADPQYQMTAYRGAIPAGWKFAGTIARDPGCHAPGAALKYTAQSADGLTAVIVMPGAVWSWSANPALQKIMQSNRCPSIDIDNAASFLVNIVVPNLRPTAKVVATLPLKPEGQAALAAQLDKARQQNADMARRFGQAPQKLTLDGATVRLEYTRDGHAVEETITAVVDCNESNMPALPGQPAYARRTCSSRSEVIMRAPHGHLDESSAQLFALAKSVQPDQVWQNRLLQDQQAAFQKMQAANNAQFQQNLRNNQAAFEQRVANNKAFQENLRASTDQAMANDRARQNAIDASAHATALHSLDRQEFKNPNTGQTIEASNQYSHQWLSSDGSTLIQTNDHSYDPNGQVYPVSQSWAELVPK
jgi:hypothetical protein